MNLVKNSKMTPHKMKLVETTLQPSHGSSSSLHPIRCTKPPFFCSIFTMEEGPVPCARQPDLVLPGTVQQKPSPRIQSSETPAPESVHHRARHTLQHKSELLEELQPGLKRGKNAVDTALGFAEVPPSPASKNR